MRSPVGSARFQKFEFKNGKAARNRVVVPPMASQAADAKGFLTDATTKHYERLAQARAGLVFVEYSYIHRTGRGESNQLAADSWDKVEALAKVARTPPAQDHFRGGLEVQEMIWVANQVEFLGVDLIDVSSGIGGWRRPNNRNSHS